MPTHRAAFALVFLCAGRLTARDTVEILREQQADFVPSPPATPGWEWDAATGEWSGARIWLQNRGIEIFGS